MRIWSGLVMGVEPTAAGRRQAVVRDSLAGGADRQRFEGGQARGG